MPRSSTLSVSANQWVQVTAEDVTNISLQNAGPDVMLVQGTAGAGAPSSQEGAWHLQPWLALKNEPLSELFPDIAATRVWVWVGTSSKAVVRHA